MWKSQFGAAGMLGKKGFSFLVVASFSSCFAEVRDAEGWAKLA